MQRDPLTLEEALARGLTKGRLRGPEWRRLGHKVYAPREAAEDPIVRLKAAARRLPGDAVFSGHTAAFVHGLESRLICIEATTRVAHLAGITVRRALVEDSEVVVLNGFRVTSLLRTAADLACRLNLVEAVVVIDAAMHRGLQRELLEQWAGSHRGHRGVRTLRRAIELAEPATESPMETRLRLALVLAGLPRPSVQTSLGFARADLYYEAQRLVIEYDGATHRDSITADNRRQNRLVDAGYRILRFSAADVLGDAAAVVALVRKALHAV